MPKLEISRPYEDVLVTQEFGAKANGSYEAAGLKGHSAIDYGVPWGMPIFNTVDDAYVFSTLNLENPNPEKYRAVFTLFEPGDGFVYEVSYGHCSAIFAKPGTTIKAGTVIANVGNTGPVFSGGVQVTKEAKLAGSRTGAHLHYQVRKLEKVKKKTGRQLIYDGNGVLKLNGFYYEVVDYDNGFHGCIDPRPLFNSFTAQNAPKVLSTYAKIIALLKQKLGLK